MEKESTQKSHRHKVIILALQKVRAGLREELGKCTLGPEKHFGDVPGSAVLLLLSPPATLPAFLKLQTRHSQGDRVKGHHLCKHLALHPAKSSLSSYSLLI